MSAKMAFEKAEVLFKDEDYEDALEKYKHVKNKFPFSPYATKSELRIAEIHYNEEEYIEAASAFEVFRELHPNHHKLPYVLFQIGDCYVKQAPGQIARDHKATRKAVKYFRECHVRFPRSKYAAKARKAEQDARRTLGKKEEYVADYYYKMDQHLSSAMRYEWIYKRFGGLGFDEKCLYRAGKGFLLAGKETLEDVLDEYDDRSLDKDARYKLRYIRDQVKKGPMYLAILLKNFPSSGYAGDAKDYIKDTKRLLKELSKYVK